MLCEKKTHTKKPISYVTEKTWAIDTGNIILEHLGKKKKTIKKIGESSKCFKRDNKHVKIWKEKTWYGWIFNPVILDFSWDKTD